MSVLTLRRKYSAKAKIAKFDVVVGVEEEISWFEIAMQNHVGFVFARRMTFTQSQEDLHEKFPNYVFGKVVLLSATSLYNMRHVAIFAVFHHYIQFVLLFVYDSTQSKNEGQRGIMEFFGSFQREK